MKGFTLVEIIVVVAISVVLILVGTGIFLSNGRFYENQKGEIMSVNATREAADRVNEFARGADSILSSRIFGGTNYTTDAAGVIFRLPAIDSSGNLLAAAYDHIFFGRDPGNASRLLLIVDGAAGSLRGSRTLEVSNRLAAVTLAYDDADPTLAGQVIYTITVTETGRSPGSEEVTGTATLRN